MRWWDDNVHIMALITGCIRSTTVSKALPTDKTRQCCSSLWLNRIQLQFGSLWIYSFSDLWASMAFCIFSIIHPGTVKGFSSSIFRSGPSLKFAEFLIIWNSQNLRDYNAVMTMIWLLGNRWYVYVFFKCVYCRRSKDQRVLLTCSRHSETGLEHRLQ